MPGHLAKATRVTRVPTTGSTNADVLAAARDGAPEGLVLVADHQTAGRGRLGRTWEAPPGTSLLVSVLLRPPADVADAVTLIAGLAMADAVRATTTIDVTLKWPNDLVVDDRKLAGILAESDWHGSSPVVVVGVGVNCNWDDVSDAAPAHLVACNHIVGHDVDRDALLDAYLERLDANYTTLLGGDRDALLEEWRARSATLGRRVRVHLADAEDIVGTAVDVDDAGHLVVRTDDATTRTFAAGDVIHLR